MFFVLSCARYFNLKLDFTDHSELGVTKMRETDFHEIFFTTTLYMHNAAG